MKDTEIKKEEVKQEESKEIKTNSKAIASILFFLLLCIILLLYIIPHSNIFQTEEVSGNTTNTDNNTDNNANNNTNNNTNETENKVDKQEENKTENETKKQTKEPSEEENSGNGNTEETNKGTFEKIVILQSNDGKDFRVLDDVDIFKNEEYLNQSLIYPGLSGEYIFKVKNENENDFKYMLIFEELNEKNINMKYKLKKNGEYIAGSTDNYADISTLNKDEHIIGKSAEDNYEIFWKWEESSNDLEAGKSIEQGEYTLKITGTN